MTRGSRLQPLARAVLRTQSDDRLVALAREGREAAFEEIVRRYRPGLVAFAAAYATASRADDVVQESLISSWDALRRTTEEIRLKPWLYTIVRNRALNARRDARPQAPLSHDLEGARRPDEVVLSGEELSRVVAAVNALPDSQREALVRSAVEGHTHEQIAAALGASPGAVRQLIYRGRLAVRDAVGLVIPVPLVRALADAGAGEAATAAAMGGAAAAGAGGASGLTKATVVAVVGTIAIGSGAALKRSADDGEGERSGPAAAVASGGAEAPREPGATQIPADPAPAADDGGAGGDGRAGSGHGADADDQRDRDHSPSGRDRDDRDGDGDGGRSSGPGSDPQDDDDDPPSHGGQGSEDDDYEVADDDDTSGGPGPSAGSGPPPPSGPGGSGSGHSGEVEDADDPAETGSGSSGSGSGDDLDEAPDAEDD